MYICSYGWIGFLLIRVLHPLRVQSNGKVPHIWIQLMDALYDPACYICDRFFRESLLHDHAYSPVRHSGAHTNGKERICSDIPTVRSLHAQIPTVHTLSVLFLPILLYTFSRFFVLGVQLSVRTAVTIRNVFWTIRNIDGKSNKNDVLYFYREGRWAMKREWPPSMTSILVSNFLLLHSVDWKTFVKWLNSAVQSFKGGKGMHSFFQLLASWLLKYGKANAGMPSVRGSYETPIPAGLRSQYEKVIQSEKKWFFSWQSVLIRYEK